jgi:hypothetical protein
MMVALLIYAYAVGERSSRRIAIAGTKVCANASQHAKYSLFTRERSRVRKFAAPVT